MSPATPLDATAAIGVDHVVTLRVPRRARYGLHILAVLAFPADSAPPDFVELGWDVLSQVDTDTGSIAVLRRAATAEEPATYEFEFGAGYSFAAAAHAGALIVATGISSAGEASDAEVSEIEAPADFIAPSADAAAYSDVRLGVFHAASDEEFSFVDASLVIAVAGVDGANLGSLAVTWAWPEQAGPTGTHEGEIEDVDGVTATFMLPATIAAIAPRWDDEIAIGLPTVGV